MSFDVSSCKITWYACSSRLNRAADYEDHLTGLTPILFFSFHPTSRPSNKAIFQPWPGPMIGGNASVDDSRIKTGSISNRSTTTHMETNTSELPSPPLEEAVKPPIVKGSSLSQEISDPQKDTGCSSLEKKKSLPHPVVQQKDEIVGGGAQELSLEELHMAVAIGGGTSENTVDDMMSLSVPIKPELKSTATSVGGGIGNDLVASGTCKGSAPAQITTSTPDHDDCDDKGKNERAAAASTTESQEGDTVVAPNVPVPAELKSQLSDDKRHASSEDLWELISISQLTSQKKLKGKAGGAPKPKVGPSDLWVKDDLGVSLALVNKLLELVSGQMTSAIKILRDTWCGCGTALKPRLPQHAPAIDWESVSKEINDENWTPKLCQAVWKYLAYADLTAADLLGNPSLAMKAELEEDSDQDDFFVDSLKLNVR